jgi:Carboxymuconolactone decarboxylase family
LPTVLVKVTLSPLDAKTRALVRIGALVVLDAAAPSFEADIETALQAGASREEIVGTLVAVMPVAGSARVTAAAPNVAFGLGYDVESALELLHGRREPRHVTRPHTTT